MQTVETLNQGLKRAYTITITAKDIDKKVDAEVKRVAPQIKMPGFRPGKVPANLVRKMHGEALAQDALNTAIQDGVQRLLADNKLRPAMQPSVALDEGYASGKDAEVKVELEVLPEVPAPSIDGLKLERLIVSADDAKVDEQIEQLASQQKQYDDAPKNHKAKTGDLVVMDFVGKVDGVPFDGGTGEGMSIEIGSGRLIPGFEDQLVGAKKGDEKQINVTFPDDYGVDDLKSKPATFDLKITDVRVGGTTKVDDELAKGLGLESLDQLRGLLKGQIENETGQLTRTYMKRKLLDQLAAGHDFGVPDGMVEAEYQQIWAQLEQEAQREDDPAAALAELEGEKGEYRAIAERRVRLGLLLSEIGQQNGVEVSQAEMNRLITQAAQQYPQDQRERFMQYVQQEPMAAAQLRAPLYEDKVVDFLFDKAEISEREVTREELEAAIESEDGAVPHVHGPDCGHDHSDEPAAKKKAAPKKKAAEQPVEDAKPAAKKAAPKKTTAKDVEPAAADAPAEAAQPKKKAATKNALPAPAKQDVAAAPAKKPAAPKAEVATDDNAAEVPKKPTAKKAPAKKKSAAE